MQFWKWAKKFLLNLKISLFEVSKKFQILHKKTPNIKTQQFSSEVFVSVTNNPGLTCRDLFCGPRTVFPVHSDVWGNPFFNSVLKDHDPAPITGTHRKCDGGASGDICRGHLNQNWNCFSVHENHSNHSNTPSPTLLCKKTNKKRLCFLHFTIWRRKSVLLLSSCIDMSGIPPIKS